MVREALTLEVEAELVIVATKDRTVQPELQRFVAKRMGATTTEVASSHVPMLSHPDLVINVIRAVPPQKRFKEPRR